MFKDELGTLKGIEAKLHVDPQAKPLFYKARTVPFALREKVEQELERLKVSKLCVQCVPADTAGGGVTEVRHSEYPQGDFSIQEASFQCLFGTCFVPANH